MVAMRLSRKGKKRQPFFRIVVLDKSFPRDGRFLEIVGTYNPRAEQKKTTWKEDRVQYWLERGAQPTQTVKQLLKAFQETKET